jgi:hypothetical protein
MRFCCTCNQDTLVEEKTAWVMKVRRKIYVL